MINNMKIYFSKIKKLKKANKFKSTFSVSFLTNQTAYRGIFNYESVLSRIVSKVQLRKLGNVSDYVRKQL